uniref:Naphthoate synthase n=1 Tax=Candidatus Kentrum sp. TC TaxID=2126339 RepID=A0A450ZWN0_9GAMM|nr:MAG: naphthoate synthase [Candidatus Kentron sp. TC]
MVRCGLCSPDREWTVAQGWRVGLLLRGDQRIRGKDGYQYEGAGKADTAKLGRLHILEVQRLIRFMPKVVIALVSGWAVGGGHSLHVICDMTIASEEHALFKQTDPDMASFDSGYGSAYLARQVGQKRAREVFFLGFDYNARDAYEMGMVNKVVPHRELEETGREWGKLINSKSPTAMRMLKFGFNLIDDGLVGQQIFAGEATRLAYGMPEAQRRAGTPSSKKGKRIFPCSPGTIDSDSGERPSSWFDHCRLPNHLDN